MSNRKFRLAIIKIIVQAIVTITLALITKNEVLSTISKNIGIKSESNIFFTNITTEDISKHFNDISNELTKQQQEKNTLEEKLEQSNTELQQYKSFEETQKAEDEENIPNITTLTIPTYADGEKLQNDFSCILSNNTLFISEDSFKFILEYYHINYLYSNNEISVNEQNEISQLLLSEAEVFESSGSVSLSSDKKTDIDNREFSGLNFNGYCKITYLLNENFEKLKGEIHVSTETENDRHGNLNIIGIKADETEVSLFSVDNLGKLANNFKNFNFSVKGFKAIRIEQNSYLDTVISNAYFYNSKN